MTRAMRLFSVYGLVACGIVATLAGMFSFAALCLVFAAGVCAVVSVSE